MWKNKRLHRIGLAGLFCACLVTLTGCGRSYHTQNDMKNVEERDYATVLMITENRTEQTFHFVLGVAQEKKIGEKSLAEEVSEWDCDDLRKLARQYSLVKGKDLSLAHLKVILISQETKTKESTGMMTGRIEQKMQDVLYMLDENEEVAKTCPVLLVGDTAFLLKYLLQEDKPVGNYFENLVRESERQGRKVTWLKDYLKAIREDMTIEPSVLQVVREGFTISEYGTACKYGGIKI